MKLKPQSLKPSKTTKLSDVDPQSKGQKGGGETPGPPADPYCARGSVGPVTHEIVKTSCKVGGKDGTISCYTKSVKCLSGPGEPEYGFSENCGKCVASPTKKPGETKTIAG